MPRLELYSKLYFKRYQTRNLYEQEKFNLQREENEGYSKLVVQLNQPHLIDISEEDLEMQMTNI